MAKAVDIFSKYQHFRPNQKHSNQRYFYWLAQKRIGDTYPSHKTVFSYKLLPLRLQETQHKKRVKHLINNQKQQFQFTINQPVLNSSEQSTAKSHSYGRI
jgi:hypothetical protein